MKDIPLDQRIIFALDVPSVADALSWVRRLEGKIRFFKVGLELFLAGGWEVVDALALRGHKVMLDLKFFDIPETVYRAVRQLNGRGVTFATVHGNNGVIEGAVRARGDLKLLAVTVLTSFDDEDMRQMGMNGPIEDLVTARAKKAIGLGCDGVVASAREAARLRRELGDDFLVVTPGIRPAAPGEQTTDDQRRVTTPSDAIRNGSDYLVIGRPIRDAKDPCRKVDEIRMEIEQALAGISP